MADNYLERKMEEHRAAQAAGRTPRRKLSPAGVPIGKMMVDFPPRRVYVTGGANGIGRAIVKAFTDAGCRVAFCDIDQAAGRATAQATGSQYHPLDVTDPDALGASMQQVIKAWGDINVIINNVGIGGFADFAESTLADFRRVLDTNLVPVWVTAHTLVCHRRTLAEPNPYGRIINISSTRHIMSEAGTEGYSASKGAVASLTHALMMSLAPYGITVNSISPGWITTRPDETLTEADRSFHPSGRVGEPKDIAAAALYLCCEQSSFVNGADIVIDGGVTHKMIYPE